MCKRDSLTHTLDLRKHRAPVGLYSIQDLPSITGVNFQLRHTLGGFREALNVSKNTLKPLKEFGEPQRYSDITPMTYAARSQEMQIAWRVVIGLLNQLSTQLLTMPFHHQSMKTPRLIAIRNPKDISVGQPVHHIRQNVKANHS